MASRRRGIILADLEERSRAESYTARHINAAEIMPKQIVSISDNVADKSIRLEGPK